MQELIWSTNALLHYHIKQSLFDFFSLLTSKQFFTLTIHEQNLLFVVDNNYPLRKRVQKALIECFDLIWVPSFDVVEQWFRLVDAVHFSDRWLMTLGALVASQRRLHLDNWQGFILILWVPNWWDKIWRFFQAVDLVTVLRTMRW
jgi:hypothetical protein